MEPASVKEPAWERLGTGSLQCWALPCLLRTTSRSRVHCYRRVQAEPHKQEPACAGHLQKTLDVAAATPHEALDLGVGSPDVGEGHASRADGVQLLLKGVADPGGDRPNRRRPISGYPSTAAHEERRGCPSVTRSHLPYKRQAPYAPGRLAQRASSAAVELAPRSGDPPGSWKCRFGHAPAGMSPQVRVHTRSAACTKVAGKLCRRSSQAASGHPASCQAPRVPGSLVRQCKESGQRKTGNPREHWRAAHSTTLKAWRRTLACQRQGAASPLTLQAASALATSAAVRSPCATSSTGRPLTRTLLAVETHPEIGNSHKRPEPVPTCTSLDEVLHQQAGGLLRLARAEDHILARADSG